MDVLEKGRAKTKDKATERVSATEQPVSTSFEESALPAGVDPQHRGSHPSLTRSGVLHLQRSVGNRATRSLLGNKPINVQRDDLDSVDAGMNLGDTASGVMASGAQIGTSAWQQTNPSGTQQGLGTAGTGEAAGIAGLTSIYETGRSIQQHAQARKAFADVKGKAGKEHLARVRGRKVDKTGGDVAKNSMTAASSVTGVVGGGFSIAGSVAGASSAATAAGNAAGVAGSVIAMPLQIFSLVRNSRRAELQRQRMGRIEALAKAKTLTAADVKPEEIVTQSSSKRDDADKQRKQAEQDRDHAKIAKGEHEKKGSEAEASAAHLKEQLAELTKQISEADLKLTLAEGAANQRGKVTGMRPASLRQQRKALEAMRAEQKSLTEQISKTETEAAEYKKAASEQDDEIKRLEAEAQAHKDTAASHEKEVTRGTDMKTDMATAKHLDAQGKTDTKMPSLQEISDYTTRKNKRGFTRRVIGAVGAGVGVAAGAVGIAAAVEALKGHAQMGANLGVAAAVIGGVATIAALGVGIWKAVSWAKKRKAQSAKLVEAAKTTPGAKAPTFTETYNPFSGDKVDQSTKRRHYATALLTYATHGTEQESDQALQIMKELDPKAAWAQVDPVTKKATMPAMTADERKELTDHFMDKMSSGG